MKQLISRTTPVQVGLSSAAIRDFIVDLEASGSELHGLMIARYGKVAAECWWAPYKADMTHTCHSLGKTYTASAVGIACTEGLLSVKEKIVDIFEEDIARLGVIPDENMQQLTVHDVLSMGNGMKTMPEIDENWVDNYLSHKVDYRPGTHFLYNTAGSCMLAEIVRRRVGGDVYDYVKPRLFDKLGIEEGDLDWLKFRNGCVAELGVLSCTEANLRLAMLYLQGGVWQGERILSEDWVKAATSLQIASTEDKGIPECKHGYGYQMWMCEPENVYRFDGGHGQYCIILPKDELIIAISEGASYPSQVQSVLEIVYKHFCYEGRGGMFTCEDCEEEEAKLQQMLRTRKLKLLPVLAEADKLDIFEGTYEVKEGDPNVWYEAHPDGKKDNAFSQFYLQDRDYSARKISIHKCEEGCRVLYNDHEEFVAYGDGHYHVISNTINPIPQMHDCASNIWMVDNDTLVFEVRWMNTCFRIRTEMKLHGTELQIKTIRYTLQDSWPEQISYARAIRV
ncbi:MAG: serine hydrolase [Lachnospiraceae bacterium]|nr:serine hydrolase [Lachnospiraceae bacterium]